MLFFKNKRQEKREKPPSVPGPSHKQLLLNFEQLGSKSKPQSSIRSKRHLQTALTRFWRSEEAGRRSPALFPTGFQTRRRCFYLHLLRPGTRAASSALLPRSTKTWRPQKLSVKISDADAFQGNRNQLRTRLTGQERGSWRPGASALRWQKKRGTVTVCGSSNHFRERHGENEGGRSQEGGDSTCDASTFVFALLQHVRTSTCITSSP